MAEREPTPAQTDGRRKVDQEVHDRVVHLMQDLANPIFRWRMAAGMVGDVGPTLRRAIETAGTPAERSALSRLVKAEQEIDQIVQSYFSTHIGV